MVVVEVAVVCILCTLSFFLGSRYGVMWTLDYPEEAVKIPTISAIIAFIVMFLLLAFVAYSLGWDAGVYFGRMSAI
jgi:hypothetical protein